MQLRCRAINDAHRVRVLDGLLLGLDRVFRASRSYSLLFLPVSMRTIDPWKAINGGQLTNNLDFAKWSAVFGDAKMVTVLFDRLTHRWHIVEMGNDSYPVTQATASTRRHTKARESERSEGA